MSWSFDDPFSGVEKALAALAQRACEETAQIVLDDAQKGAPVDKGALKASAFVVTPGDSESAQLALDAVKRANPQAQTDSPLNIEDWGDEGMAQAWIDFLVVYARFVAYGYHRGGRFIPGRDFLGASLSRHRDTLERIAQRELDGLTNKS